MMGEQGPTMKRRRHTPEQVVRKLREADRMLAEGKTTVEVARALENLRQRQGDRHAIIVDAPVALAELE
jgi:hypothetical protein